MATIIFITQPINNSGSFLVSELRKMTTMREMGDEWYLEDWRLNQIERRKPTERKCRDRERFLEEKVATAECYDRLKVPSIGR